MFEAFDIFDDYSTFPWKYIMLLGIVFIVFGLLIIAAPVILVVLVASFFIMSGIMFVHYAWRAKRIRKNDREAVSITIDDMF